MMKHNKKYQELGINLLITCIALILAFIVGAILILILGENPLKAYEALFKGAVGTPIALTISLSKSVPLILTGLAVGLAFKCKVFNIGAEGQLLFGAFLATLVGIYVKVPAPLHILLVLIAGFVGGLVWSFVPAYLRYKRNVHIVISTIMFNYIGQYLVQYMVCGPFKEPGPNSATAQIQQTAMLPRILPKPYALNLGFIVAIIMVVVIYILLNKTTIGYEMRSVGLNADAAKTNGINVKKNMFLALLLSGGLAGLAGSIEVSGSIYRMVDGFSPGYGFNGIPVALLAHNNPFAVIFSACLLGFMRSGAIMMQASMGISQEIIDVIQGTVIIFICTEYLIRYYVGKIKGGKIKC